MNGLTKKKIDMKFRITFIEDIDMNDYPDFCDAFCAEAEVFENGDWREATEAELDTINDEHRDSVNEAIFDQQMYL
jgi:hypothetical protein